MSDCEKTWGVILAGGEGTRLDRVAVDASGRPCPKQFWAFDGAKTLLRTTLERAWATTSRETVLTVVTSSHRTWWQEELTCESSRNIVEQPENKGTALGLLAPLLEIRERALDSRVVVLPSDHHVVFEEVLRDAIRRTLGELDECGGGPVLLGIAPDRADSDLGWIVPERRAIGASVRVAEFVEKPDPITAIDLFNRGALWNSFILVARTGRLIELFDRSFPRLSVELDAARRVGRLDETYAMLPEIDFSRHVLHGVADGLWTYRVPRCGWSDIGTPDRVQAARLRSHAAFPSRQHRASQPVSPPSLREEATSRVD